MCYEKIFKQIIYLIIVHNIDFLLRMIIPTNGDMIDNLPKNCFDKDKPLFLFFAIDAFSMGQCILDLVMLVLVKTFLPSGFLATINLYNSNSQFAVQRKRVRELNGFTTPI